MADFKVQVYKVEISEHPDADRLEVAHIANYQSIVEKGEFKSGDHVAYIPEASVLPDSLIEEMGLTDKLAGEEGNRVRAIKLRKVLSQGLVYKVDDPIGTDVTERLGITKYVPEIPASMNGEVQHAFGKVVRFDVENIKLYPDALQEGERVVITEKLHGTCCIMGYYNDEPIVASKGLSHQGLCFKFSERSIKKNIYIKTFMQYKERLDEIHKDYCSFYVLGEVFGKGIQDLHYDRDEPCFKMFDFYAYKPRSYGGHYFTWADMSYMPFDIVPLLYKGEYSKDLIDEYTDGKSVLASHKKEGIVIKTDPIRYADFGGVDVPVALKSISEKHLLREGGTEYN